MDSLLFDDRLSVKQSERAAAADAGYFASLQKRNLPAWLSGDLSRRNEAIWRDGRARVALRTGTGENLSYMNPLGIDWQVAYVCVAVMVIVSLAALAAFGWRFRRTEGASQFLLLIG